MERSFKYPLFYKLQYLWSTSVCAVVMILAAGYLFLTRDPLAIALALVISVPFLLGIHAAEKKLSLLPVEIRIEDGSMSLYRFNRYARLSLASITGLRMNQNPGYPPITGGWVEVTYKADNKEERFYIGPYISGFVELVETLRSRIAHVPVEKVLFCWPKRLRIYQWAASLAIVAIVAVLATTTLQGINTVWQVLETVTYLVVVASVIWALGTSPICVEIGDDRIVFKFPIRPDAAVQLSEIVSVDGGGHLTFFSINVRFSSIRLRNGKRIVLAPCASTEASRTLLTILSVVSSYACLNLCLRSRSSRRSTRTTELGQGQVS